MIIGTRAVVFGVGNINQRIAEVLKSAGVSVTGVGRTPRTASSVFGNILGRQERFIGYFRGRLGRSVMPETPNTEGCFGSAKFGAPCDD